MSQSKEFKEIQDKWYAKLKKEGFEDIEDVSETHRPERDLKKWHSFAFQLNNSADDYSDKERYYQLAGQFLHEYEFKNKLERSIWEGHAEGLSIREISRKLNKYRDLIFKILKQQREIMLKTYGVK